MGGGRCWEETEVDGSYTDCLSLTDHSPSCYSCGLWQQSASPEGEETYLVCVPRGSQSKRFESSSTDSIRGGLYNAAEGKQSGSRPVSGALRLTGEALWVRSDGGSSRGGGEKDGPVSEHLEREKLMQDSQAR